MENQVIETRPAVLVNIVDASGNVIAEQIMQYEVEDFLRLRVDPRIATACRTVAT